MKDIKYFKLTLNYLKKDKLYLFFFVLVDILYNVVPLLVSIFWAQAVNSITIMDQPQFIINLVLWVLSEIISWGIIQIIHNYIYIKLENDFIRESSVDLYKKMINLPALAYEDMGVGELTNRLTSDTSNIMNLLKQIINLSTRLITAVVVFIYSFTVSIYVGLEFTALGIVMYLLANVYYPKIKKFQENISKQGDKIHKNATEDFSGIREIKALGIKDEVIDKTSNNLVELTNNQKKIYRVEENYYAINNIVYFIIEFIIFLNIGILIFINQSTLAMFLIIQTLIWRFDSVIENLSNFGVNYNKVIVSLKRIDEIINNKKYSDEKFGNEEIKDKTIDISFKNVYFKYRKNEDYILKGLTCELIPNKKIAIVGKSGQGKSTIFNLLMRYFDVSKGEILINGININELTEKSLRSNLSIIRQDPYLFNQSIFDNFKMVKQDTTLKEVREVCKKSYIDDYIMSLPKKYNTIIGEGGVNLSGGQKQRLAIARTLLKNTKVILFDEATSSLDNESQEYIKKTIDDLVKTHTIVIVAHRLSTIMDADIIYLIDDGKVLAKGNHNELILKSKLYKKLYNPEILDDNDIVE